MGVVPVAGDQLSALTAAIPGSSDLPVQAPRNSLELLGQLRHAIDRGELQLVYQPQVALRTGEVLGVEALVRWPHPDHGLLEPIEFLPLARSNGLMDALTEVALVQALDDAAYWYARGHRVPVSVNVSTPSFADCGLPGRISNALSASGLCADRLTLEITEDVVLRDMYETRTALSRLRESGIRVSIDDFGSGYSQLRYLRELPIDEVKLDREFVLPILDDPRATAIVRAVIDLAHALDLTCVAEGVENEATARRLQEFGCDLAQGYHYGAPVSNTMLLEMLRADVTAESGNQDQRFNT
jgi:EAL domain-containing protein (putative c-di-GMP-specific phosphodiesterase class I)